MGVILEGKNIYQQQVIDSDRVEDKLVYLVEECGEVVAAAGKGLRFGIFSYNPELKEEDREYNVDWILRELVDLETAIAIVKEVLLFKKKKGLNDSE